MDSSQSHKNGRARYRANTKISKVDPAYMLTGYNAVRCGVCGIYWPEHPRNVCCNRYRPPDSLIGSLCQFVKRIVVRNVTPDRSIKP